MNIEGNVSLEELRVNNAAASDEELLEEYCRTFFTERKELKPLISAGVCALKGRINEKLQERREVAYDAILGIVSTPEYARLAPMDDELKAFATAATVYQMERGGSYPLIFEQIEYIDDFYRIHQQLLFYFRRMQLRLAKPLLMEAMTFIRSHKLTVFAVVQILMDCTTGEKDKVALTLADLYLEQKSVKEALFVVSVMAENCSVDQKALFEQKKAEILESF